MSLAREVFAGFSPPLCCSRVLPHALVTGTGVGPEGFTVPNIPWTGIRVSFPASSVKQGSITPPYGQEAETQKGEATHSDSHSSK